MSNDPTAYQRNGCGIMNIILPVAMAVGAVLGGCVGLNYGTVFGVLGGVVGFFLAIPACGLILTAILGMLVLLDWLRGGHSNSDSESSTPQTPNAP